MATEHVFTNLVDGGDIQAWGKVSVYGLPGFTAVIGCPYSSCLCICIASYSGESAVDALDSNADAPSLITLTQVCPSSVDRIIPV